MVFSTILFLDQKLKIYMGGVANFLRGAIFLGYSLHWGEIFLGYSPLIIDIAPPHPVK
jgi:hypothetical protein